MRYFFGLVLSGSALATDLDNIVNNVRAVCQSPSQQGKYWNITTTGKAGANAIVRLVSTGLNAEATFTKGEWEGVQQVLREQQSSDNSNYRDCAIKLTPLFVEKFSTSELPTPVKGINQQSFGHQSPNIHSGRDASVNYNNYNK